MPDRRAIRAELSKMAGFIGDKDRKAYDVRQFYLRSTDHRGHSKQMSYDLPPDERAMMSELLGCGLFPYRSYADIIRDAIHHRCHYLLEPANFTALIPEILDNLARKEIMEILDSRKRALKFYGQVKAEIRGVLAQMDSGDYPEYEAREMLEQVRAHAETMREPYRGKLLAFLAEAGAAGGLKAVPDDDDEDDDDTGYDAHQA